MGSRLDSRVYGTRWRRVRLEVLERDGWRCQIAGEHCRVAANEVDHVQDWRDGGALYDLANLRASCGWCNRSRSAKKKAREGWRRARTRVVLVVGPPASGKSTYVAEHAAEGDVVVDYDALVEAVGGTARDPVRNEAANAARNALLKRVREGEIEADTAWIVSSRPDAEQVFPFHEVVEVDPGRDEVLRRCGESRPAWFARLVAEWYANRGRLVGAGRNPSREW